MRSVGDSCDHSTLRPTPSIRAERLDAILQHPRRHPQQSTTFDSLEDLPIDPSRKQNRLPNPPLPDPVPAQTRARALWTSWIFRGRPLRARICCATASFLPGRTMPLARSSIARTRCRRRTRWLRRYGGYTARPRSSYPTRSGWRI